MGAIGQLPKAATRKLAEVFEKLIDGQTGHPKKDQQVGLENGSDYRDISVPVLTRTALWMHSARIFARHGDFFAENRSPRLLSGLTGCPVPSSKSYVSTECVDAKDCLLWSLEMFPLLGTGKHGTQAFC